MNKLTILKNEKIKMLNYFYGFWVYFSFNGLIFKTYLDKNQQEMINKSNIYSNPIIFISQIQFQVIDSESIQNPSEWPLWLTALRISVVSNNCFLRSTTFFSSIFTKQSYLSFKSTGYPKYPSKRLFFRRFSISLSSNFLDVLQIILAYFSIFSQNSLQ